MKQADTRVTVATVVRPTLTCLLLH